MIDAAEEIPNPLDGLLERVKEDPGAAFTLEVLEALAMLKKDDRAAFETLRTRLRKAGCRVTALDKAIKEEHGEVGQREPTQSDILVKIAEEADLFHAPDDTAYADVVINGALADCCAGRGPTEQALRAAGIGQAT